MADSKQAGKPRSKIQASIEKARAEQRLEIFKKRIELAKQGLKAFETGQQAEAIKQFNAYLRIMEDWKDASGGGLNPSFFDRQKDVPEMLLISGVYWTLVKIYDRTSEENKKEFMHYLEKYLVFSKGMPFQKLSAENLRKYISGGKPVHKTELQNAYKMIGSAGCFIATSLLDVTDVETLPRLRRFRDEVLEKNRLGRGLVGVYYKTAPTVAACLDRLPNRIRKYAGAGLDRLAKSVSPYF